MRLEACWAILSSEPLREREAVAYWSWRWDLEMSSFLGLDIVVPVCVGSVLCWGRVLPGLDEGVVDGLVFTVLGEPSCLGVFERESSVPVRRAYGSAVAGRASSGRRGFMAGRIGADDREEM